MNFVVLGDEDSVLTAVSLFGADNKENSGCDAVSAGVGTSGRPNNFFTSGGLITKPYASENRLEVNQ